MSSIAERPDVRTALCCECGNLRTVKTKAARRNYALMGASPDRIADMMRYAPEYWSKVTPWHRWLEDLKCAACGRITRHADVRTGDCLDEAEEQNGAPILDGDDAWTIVDAAIEQLEVFDVRVDWQGEFSENTLGRLTRYLDDGVYFLELNDKAPASTVLAVIDRAWSDLLGNANKWWVRPQRGDDPACAWRCYGRRAREA